MIIYDIITTQGIKAVVVMWFFDIMKEVYVKRMWKLWGDVKLGYKKTEITILFKIIETKEFMK